MSGLPGHETNREAGAVYKSDAVVKSRVAGFPRAARSLHRPRDASHHARKVTAARCFCQSRGRPACDHDRDREKEQQGVGATALVEHARRCAGCNCDSSDSS